MIGKKTIIVEDRLREIFNYLPEINGFKPVFKTGDQKELLAFFRQSESKTNYPLIWMEMPYEEDHQNNRKRVKVDSMNLILSVETNVEMLNSERLETTYKKYLYVLLDNVIDVFVVANTISFDNNFRIAKYSNYSDQLAIDEGVSPDIWDAIKLTIDVELNDKCLREIKI